MVRAAKYDLFISYHNADRAWVEGYLLDALTLARVKYHTEAAFALGTVKVLEFERAIQQSKRTLLVLSPAYLTEASNQFIEQLAQWYGEETQTWPVIPLLLDPMELPPRLSILVRLNATNSEEREEAIRRLCKDLKYSVPASTVKPACPYPGMMPFSEEMSARFFGRDQEIQEFLHLLRLHPFIAVIGPSGSGKSSLVLAGLLPQLRHSSLFGSGEWLIQTMRPSETPLAVLKTLLGSEPTNLEPAVTEALRASPNTQRLLLVVDQFEEVFTLAGEEAVPFGEALLGLLKVPNCYLILTVRADFYPELMGSPLWHKIKSHRLEVVPLDAAGLREAIIKPAEDINVFVEATLVERIVVDAAGEPGVLPLIQETLLLLWQGLERRFLPLRAYEALVLSRKAYGGLSSKKLTGLQVAIARRADAAIADLSAEQQKIGRRIFLRLVHFGEGRADTRRQQSVNDLRSESDDPHLFDQTLQHLADCRLLTLSGEEQTSSTKADIAHEALISGWPILQAWLSERREAEQIRRRLVAIAEQWERLGKGSGGLLDEVELAEAQRWLNSLDAEELGVNQILTELVAASDRAIQEAKKREEEAKQREVNLIKERLEQETKARKASQTRNRIAIVSAVMLSGLAFFAVYQWRNAEIGQIRALNQSSQAKFTVNQHSFDALVDALRAGKRLKRFAWGNSGSQIQVDTMKVLSQAVFWINEQNRLEGHTSVVLSLSFSPNGQAIASASGDGTIKLWRRDGSVIATLKGHKDVVTSVSFSPNGQFLASGSLDTTVRLWRQDGTLLPITFSNSGKVRAVSFSPDSQLLAAAGDDGTVKIWQLDGNVVATLKGHQAKVNSISFSPDGQIIASASKDRTVKLWRRDGSLIKTLKGHQAEVNSVSFSPDGQILASGSLDNTVKLWKRNDAFIKALTFKGHKDGVETVSFSPDGKIIASAGRDNTVKLWQQDGTLLTTLTGHTNIVTNISFSPDGQVLGSASYDGSIKLWQLKNPMQTVLINYTNTTNSAFSNGINSVSFSPDGQLLASASADHNVKLWRRDGSLITTLKGHQDWVNGVSFSSNGQILASSSSDRTVNLWRLNGSWIRSLKGQIAFIDVSFSPDNQTIATTDFNGMVQLWRQQDGKLIKTFKAHNSIAYSVRFSPNNQILATAGADGTVKLWKTDDGTPIATLKEPKDKAYNFYQVRFSPDSQMIAAASKDGTVKLWKTDGTLVTTLGRRNHSPVKAISFNPNGQIIASGNEEGTIFLWRLDGTLITDLTGHTKEVISLSFSPDGKVLASASDDATIILWNLDNLDLNRLLTLGCSWIQDYLKTNPNVDRDDRNLCR